jgi:hypothetical protein
MLDSGPGIAASDLLVRPHVLLHEQHLACAAMGCCFVWISRRAPAIVDDLAAANQDMITGAGVAHAILIIVIAHNVGDHAMITSINAATID